jgi:hypothetical protein
MQIINENSDDEKRHTIQTLIEEEKSLYKNK